MLHWINGKICPWLPVSRFLECQLVDDGTDKGSFRAKLLWSAVSRYKNAPN